MQLLFCQDSKFMPPPSEFDCAIYLRSTLINTLADAKITSICLDLETKRIESWDLYESNSPARSQALISAMLPKSSCFLYNVIPKIRRSIRCEE